jgi:predicted dehydrogenase
MGPRIHRGGEPVGWGILGTGLTAHRFARDLRAVRGARLAAVASRSRERAAAAAAAMGAAVGLEGRAELLAREDVDIVYIATPSRLHHADCLAALAAGKHVLCEKPLAMTAQQAREIAAAATAAGRFCMEALWTQFIPALAEAERLLAAGRIGAPHVLIASFGLPTWALADGSPMPDGGALLDRGCYPISLALRLFGPPLSVAGRATSAAGQADLTATASLGFAGGKTALIAVSLVDQLENHLFLGGDRGGLTLNDITCPTSLTFQSATAAQPAPAPAAAATGVKARLRETARIAVRQSRLLTGLKALAGARARILPCRGFGYVHEIEHVHTCLREGRLQSGVHPLERSIDTLAVIEAILASAIRTIGDA